MSGFPLNLDLSEYFSDLREYSCVYVNQSKNKTVGDVLNHIKSVFGLEDNICLVHKKVLIPKSESLQILQLYDIYKVQKCNFYDVQIHKTRKDGSNSTCDQKALNLTQAEKTIDLSCRPKQRLKTNVCAIPGACESLSLNAYCKKSTNYQVSQNRDILINGNQTAKEKSKHKKRRHLQDSESDGEGDILDMSVKDSKRKKHSNCFSTDDRSLLSDCVNDANSGDVLKEQHKKPKKKKKHTDEAGEAPLELTDGGNGSRNEDKNNKIKHKKVKEDQFNRSSIACANYVSLTDVQEDSNDYENHIQEDEHLTRKKHRHSKKNSESKCTEESQRNQYYSSTPVCDLKDSIPNDSISKTSHDISMEEKKNLLASRLQSQIDSIILGIKQSSDSKHEGKSNGISYEQSTSDSVAGDEEENNIAEGEFSSDVCVKKPKRKRKHNKKKKKEKRLLTAVGPILSQLKTQPIVTKQSESSKHIFFSEQDVEETNVPSTSPQKSQKDSLNVSQSCQSKEQPSSSPSWKDNLLRLASSGVKPMVFVRKTNVSASKQSDSQAQDHSAVPCTEHTNPKNSDSHETPEEDVQRCNGEVNGEINGCAGPSNEDGRNGLPDICKPPLKPNSLQDINLSNYPIIDKVVTGDYILFKVWKFNDNGEAELSKPILAKVEETKFLPDKISLLVMEGSDECVNCAQVKESDGSLTIDLQWTDINEPRLFYP
ncbi:uncharacterized protein LOC128990807 [Macrosteles quadrilineatus]|uniref:uncharacterized protein LOC128990807 n=1 Tax=Macrosteles quadrilineatus TaxID=74068 RepID=UPI0023E18F50|nr:uncharacterized protein LOC128990807 [Macrosteles quadrilineatus]